MDVETPSKFNSRQEQGMFDIDSRTIIAEIEVDVFFMAQLLDALPAMCALVWQDEVISSLYGQMRARVEELHQLPDGKQDVEKFLVCGFGKQT